MAIRSNKISWSSAKLFYRLLNNKTYRSYWDYIRELRARPTAEVFNTSLALTFRCDAKSRMIGVNVLAQLGVASRPFLVVTLSRYFELLETEKDNKVLTCILISVGHNNGQLSKKQIATLCGFALAKDRNVRQAVVSSLLTVDDPLAIDTLIILSTDRVANIRDWATFGLGSQISRNNAKIRAALWARVDDADQDTRFEAIVGLAERKDERIKDIIIRELMTKDYGALLFDAVQAMPDKRYLALLQQHYKGALSESGIDEHWLWKLKECIADLKKKLKAL